MTGRTLRAVLGAAVLVLAGCPSPSAIDGGEPDAGPSLAAPAGLAYADPSPVYRRGMAIAPNAPSSSGGPVETWALSPATLPPGLTFDAQGVIAGTPTAVAARQSFVVTASNAAGSTDVTLAITVIDRPTLSYAMATGTSGTVGTAMRVAPTMLLANEAPLTACATKAGTPTLPAGLSVNASTCELSGTPTEALAATDFTLVASNAAGASDDARVTLTIAASAPVLSYAGATGTTGTFGTAMTVAPTTLSTGGAPLTGCGLTATSDPLPTGLSVDATTCVISGNPLIAAPATVYTLVATNAVGPSLGAAVTLTVNPAPPSLSYAGATGTTAAAGAPLRVTPTILSLNGGPLTGCGVKPATTPLPPGLAVDPATCVISGTASAALPATQFLIVATNGGGSSLDAPVTLTITAAAPTLSFVGAADTTTVVGQPFRVTPRVLLSNGAPITGCAVTGSPPAPAWMSIAASTCVLSGTPPSVFGPTTFTVVATNAAGASTPAPVTLEALAAATAPTLSYAGATGTTGRVGAPMTVWPTTMNANGSPVMGCALSGAPALPSGLSLDPATCAISGTPSAVLPATAFSVVATNGVGSSTPASVMLEVRDVPTLSYVGASGTTGTIGSPLSVAPTTLLANGAAVTDCGIKSGTTVLPASLSVDPQTCVISGTPSAALPATAYTLIATNAVGPSAAATVTLTVNPGVPVLSYGGASGTTGLVGVPMSVTPTTLQDNGGALTGCAAASLPAGLGVNAQTCVISGTPTARAPTAAYDVTATNAAGSSLPASVTLTVRSPALLSISDGPTWDFGAWAPSTSVDHLFRVTNTGDVAATGVSATPTLGAGFSFKGGSFPGLGGDCAATLAGGATCLVVVSFSPPSAATFTGALSLSYQDGVQPRTATRALTGAGTAQASLAITDFPPLYYRAYGVPADGPTFDFGQIGLGRSVDHAFYVTNNGGAAATLTGGGALAAPFSYQGGTFPGTEGTCSGSLAPGQSCVVVVTYVGASGTATASLSVTSSGGPTTAATRSLTGTGTATAALRVYDFGAPAGGINVGPAWDFGVIGVGGSAEHTFSVLNLGGATAAGLGAGLVSAGFSFPGGFPGGTPGTRSPTGGDLPYCGGSLAAGAACGITVRFSPTTAAVFSGSVTVAWDTNQGVSRAVTGVGTTAALLTVREEREQGLIFDFGTRPAPSTTTEVFLVRNIGGQAATALTGLPLPTGFSYSGDGGFPGGAGPYVDRDGTPRSYCALAGGLDAGAACAVSVDFRPTASGSYSGTVAVRYGDGTAAMPTATRAVTGTGTTQAIVSISQCSSCNGEDGSLRAELGTVPTGGTRTVTLLLRNDGAIAATLSDGGLSGHAAFTYPGGAFPGGSGTTDFQGRQYAFCGPAPYALAPGAECLVSVSYSAPATPGTQTGRLTITTASSVSPSVGLDLSASSTNLAIVELRDCDDCGGGGGGGGTPTHDFGSVRSPSTGTGYFFLRNTGATAATLTSGTVGGAAFSFTGGTWPGGAPGSQVTVNGRSYTFCPATGGALAAGSSCVLSVTYSASGSTPQTGSLSVALGNATAASVGYALSVSPTTLAIVGISTCPSCGNNAPPGWVPTYDFGQVASPSTRTAYFFVTNSGASAATLTNGGINGAAFSWAGGAYPGGPPGGPVQPSGGAYSYCPASGGSLPSGGTCVIVVTYSASGTAPQSGDFSLTVGGATTPTLAYRLTGSPTTAAIVSISQCPTCGDGGGGGGGSPPTYNFGFVPSPSTRTVTLVVRNQGASATTLSSTGITGPGYAFTGGTYPGGSGTLSIFGGVYSYCPPSGGTLAAGASCLVSVTYSASGTSPQSGGFSLSLTGATQPTASYAFTATPTTQAMVSITTCEGCGGPMGGGGSEPVPVYDFGFVPSPSSNALYLFVRNTGVSPATLTSAGVTGAGFDFTGGSYPGGTAGASVTINGNPYTFCPALNGTVGNVSPCVVSITYSASGTAPQQGGLTLGLSGATTSEARHDFRGTPTTQAIVSLSDNPGGGGCCGSTPTHDFGVVASPSTQSTFFWVRNTGAAATTVTSGGVTGAAFGFTGGTYPGGTPGATVNVWGGTYAFCPASGGVLAAGATCVLQVTYSATGTAQQTGSFALTLTGATATTLSYELRGSPTTSAIVSMRTCPDCGGGGGPTTPEYDFGVVPSPSTQTLDLFVRNSGTGAATLTDQGVTGTGYGYTGGSYPGGTAGAQVTIGSQQYTLCPASGGTLAGGATCVLRLTWSASGTTPQTGGVRLGLTGATTSVVGYDFTGTPTTEAIVGISTCVGCGPAVLVDYGTAGTALDRIFVVRNSGGPTATLAAGAALAAPFSYSTGSYPGGTGSTSVFGSPVSFCGASLPGGASCAISVRYSGTSTGTATVSLALGGAYTPTAEVTVSGTTTNRALLTVSEESGFFGCTDATCSQPYWFGAVGVMGLTARDFLVTNRGALTATIAGAAPLATGFAFGTMSATAPYPGGTGTGSAFGSSYPYCGPTLAPGAQCLVSVRFQPSTPATRYSSAVNLTYGDSVGAVTPNASRSFFGDST